MRSDPLIRTIEIRDKSGRVVGTKEVVTYPGLLSKAHEEGLKEIRTSLVQPPTKENGMTAIAKALVVTEKGSFEGLGDASPENVNSFIVPHLIRMAETRAKARSLRDAVNIGIVSFEEIDGEHLSSANGEVRPLDRAAAFPIPRERGNGDTGNGRTRRPAAASKPSGHGDEKMTEPQRRYLFRILAGQGLEGEAAHEYLLDLLQVESLKEVSKAKATETIDRLLQATEKGAARAGTVH